MTGGGAGSGRAKSGVSGMVWPPIATGTAAVIAALVARLDEMQWEDADTIAARQREQLVQVARHCARQSPMFRTRLSRAKLSVEDLGAPGGLAALPPMTRRDLQAPAAEIYCAETPQDHLPLNLTTTSGATGEPVAVRRTAATQLLWMAITMRDHHWHGRDFSRPLVAIRATPAAEGRQADWGPPANLLYDTGPALRLSNTSDAAQLAERILGFAPGSLLIYPATLAAVLHHCRVRGLRFPGLAHIRTIGETLPAELRDEAAAYFAASVEDSYTSQEMGYMALQCPASGLYHVMAENILLEVLDDSGHACEPGAIGRVVVTDLHNFATPMIRYDIGDYAEVAAPCPCGRGLPTLKRIVGRERNLILMPDGTRHWPLTGYWRFRDAAPVRQYQMIQTGRGTIEVRLVADRALTSGEEDALRGIIHKALGHDFALDFKYWPDRLPFGANGKFEEFVCRVAA